jgi:hypothetical protein
MTKNLLLAAKTLIAQAAKDPSLPEPKRQSLNVACLGLDRVLNYLDEQREWDEKLKASK